MFSKKNRSLSDLKSIRNQIYEFNQNLAKLSTNLANHLEDFSIEELNEGAKGQLLILKESKKVINEVRNSMVEIAKVNENESISAELENRLNKNIETFEAILEVGIHSLADYIENFQEVIGATPRINNFKSQISSLSIEIENLTNKIRNTEVSIEHNEEKGKKSYRR